MSNTKDLYKQFTKPELVKVGKELSLELDPTFTSRQVVDLVAKDLEINGVPEVNGASDLMGEFLIAGEWIDEKGNLIQDQRQSEEAIIEEDVVDDVKPECYGFEDSRDPACKQCRLQGECNKQRVANRPECYGKAFSKNAPECAICIEAGSCMLFNQSN